MPDWFLTCKHCGEHLGRIDPKRDGQYRVTGWDFIPYAIPQNKANMPGPQARGSPIICHKCGKETPLSFPEEGTP